MKKAMLGEFQFESGEVLPHVELGYETFGQYRPEAGNAILVCHALTGDVNAAGDVGRSGWWDGLIGPGKPIDTNQYFVICSNVLGGCYGSTGPATIDPQTNRPYATRFPVVTIRDMVRAQRMLIDQLGIDKLYAVIGGSMGGMQVYEWAIEYPEMMRLAVPIATCSRISAVAIAYNDVARQAICSDPEWQNGEYYPAVGPTRGLSIARMIGMITYRTAELFEERFGRNLQSDAGQHLYESTFQIESYLRYQGEKLVKRFDANSYLYLLKAMDTHDIGRGRGGIEAAISRIQAKILSVAISNDLLYPVDHQAEMDALLKQNGIDSHFYQLESKFGHDGFLVEFAKMGEIVAPYFA